MYSSEKALIRPTNSDDCRTAGFRSGPFLIRFICVLSIALAAAGPTRAYPEPALPTGPTVGPVSRMAVLLRVENHDGFGRLTFPAAARGTYSLRRDGEKLVIVRPRDTRVGNLPQLPRNILEISSDAVTTVLTVRAGARIRTDRVRGDLILTVYDPVGRGTKPETPPSGANKSRSQPSRSAVAVGLTSTKAADSGPAPAKPATVQPVIEPEQDAARNDPAQSRLALEFAKPNVTQIQMVPGAVEPTILLPAGDAGLAAFQLRDEAIVVLDKPFDFSPPSSDTSFGRLVSQKTEDATMIRIPLRDPGLVRISRSQQGWVITAGAHKEALNDVIPLPVETGPATIGVRLTVSAPGRVVSLSDPQNGTVLLVGTQTATGQAVLESREYSQYRLLPTTQGVVVSPISKDVSLRREGLSFVLIAGPLGKDAVQPNVMMAAASTPVQAPLFDFPNESAPALFDKLQHELRAVSEAPALARTDPRLKVGETMVALGLGVEAQSVLEVATVNDPSLLSSPRAIGLHAVAAMLAGRLDAASTIADPRLDVIADGRLWRSLLAVVKEQVSAEDAQTLAAEMPMLLSYPPALRDKFLPRALESMASSGQAALASDVLATLPATPELDLARGITFETLGQPTKALEQYDRVAGRNDRQAAYRASIRAVELRMKAGTLDGRTGTDALDRNLFGWREASQEIPLRIRIASLRRQSGQWREALTVLKDGIVAYPESRAQLDDELAQTLLALFAGDAAKNLSPADLVGLYDKNIETVQSMSWPERTGLRLVDCLIALGLPARAEPVLAKMVAQAADPGRRPFLGARLADVRLDMNDPAGAIAALAATAPAQGVSVDASTVRDRQMLYAQAETRRGNTDAALSMLQNIGTPEADSARADIYVAQKDWIHAVSALTSLEQKRVPQSGSLTEEQQAIVTRLAVAAALGEDAATLKRVTDIYGATMASTASAGLFRIITSNPVRGTTDLPRAFEEIKLARKMTAQTGLRTPP